VCEIESEPSVHLVLSQLISLRSFVCSALDFFISGDTADIYFNRKIIQLMQDIWINVIWSSVSGLAFSSLYLSRNHPSKAKGWLLSSCPSPCDNQLDSALGAQ